MTINNITAVDYGYDGGRLWIKFTGTHFDAVRGMNTAQFDVVTDTGDPVETITGFQTVEGIQYDAQRDVFTAIYAPDIVDTEKERLRAENKALRETMDGLRSDALELQADVTVLSQSVPADIMPVVHKLEGVTAAVIGTLGLSNKDTEGVE